MTFEAMADQKNSGEWRVEAIDFNNEGQVYVAIFSGPNAEKRAEEYAIWKNEVEQHMQLREAS